MASARMIRRCRTSCWRALGHLLVLSVAVLGLLLPITTLAQDATPQASSDELFGNFTVVISIPDVQRDIANGPSSTLR